MKISTKASSYKWGFQPLFAWWCIIANLLHQAAARVAAPTWTVLVETAMYAQDNLFYWVPNIKLFKLWVYLLLISSLSLITQAILLLMHIYTASNIDLETRLL